MFWRAAAALAVLFWAVMTGLLVRDVYFPAESRFTEVPARFVFDLFLKQATVNADTLHLYHRQEKIGHATINITSKSLPDGETRYQWVARGIVERLQGGGTRVNATWEVSGEMDEAGQWHQMEIIAAMPEQNASVKLRWKDGERFPKVTITQDGRAVVDTDQAGLLMALGLTAAGGDSGSWMKALGQLAGQSDEMQKMQVTAREGTVDIAGRERRCYLVTVPFPGSPDIRLIFSETGEIARIELPQDYRLIEPMIHGMIPPLPDADGPATPP